MAAVCAVNSACSAAGIRIFQRGGDEKVEGIVMVGKARKEPDRHAPGNGF
jgi:hypothetical protein